MLKKKLNIFIIFIVGFFLAVDFTWYSKSLEQLHVENTQRESIIFLNLKVETTRLLDKMMYSYEQEKDTLEKKHKIVYNYLIDKPNFMKLTLDEIYKKINKNTKNNPYDIYITDKNFVIRNSTHKQDLGLDLSFAKDVFLSDYKQKKVGISTPIYDSDSKTFFSYTSSFLKYKDKKGNILQISYNYKNLDSIMDNIKSIFTQFPSIKEHKCYTISSENQAYEIILKDYKPYKVDIKEIYRGIENGKNISNKLIHKDLYVENIIQDKTKYAVLYASEQASILRDNTKVLYYLLLDENNLEKNLQRLNISIIFITFIGVLAIIFFSNYIHKLLINPILELQENIQNKELSINEELNSRKDEIGELFRYYNHYYVQIKNTIDTKDELLQDKNRFVHNAIHEINTPLSIISTNNSLRDLVQGENEYSTSIVSAVKTMKNTMDDLNFSMHNNKMIGEIKIINLADFLKERVDYFHSIANSSGIDFQLLNVDKCYIKISEIELTRLIDNNLSNAIKYSFIDTDVVIDLSLEDDSAYLSFTNEGEEITDVDKIFKRFVREDNLKGGFGLGLNIVKFICDKYNIKIVTTSKNRQNKFEYHIKCHTKVTT